MNDVSERTTRPAAAIDINIDIALLVLRIGIGAAALHAGLVKALDFGVAVDYLTADGWRLPELAAFMVTATETLGGIGLLLGMFTPLMACAVVGAMLDAWAVNVSGAAFWSDPFNVPFLLVVGATTLLFAGAGAYSIDARLGARGRWSTKAAGVLFVIAILAAVVTWIALKGTNPIHVTAPTG